MSAQKQAQLVAGVPLRERTQDQCQSAKAELKVLAAQGRDVRLRHE